MIKNSNFRGLIVWQKAIYFVTLIYKTTNKFPKSEIFGLANQMNRVAVSIASNLAEGSYRSSKKDFRYFLLIAYGSCAEIETQIEIAKSLKFMYNIDEIEELLLTIEKMLSKLIKSYKN